MLTSSFLFASPSAVTGIPAARVYCGLIGGWNTDEAAPREPQPLQPKPFPFQAGTAQLGSGLREMRCSPVCGRQMSHVKAPPSPSVLPDGCLRGSSREQPTKSPRAQGEGGRASFITVTNVRSMAAYKGQHGNRGSPDGAQPQQRASFSKRPTPTV